MQSIKNLIPKLNKDYPQFIFKESNQFSWSPNEKTLFYKTNDKEHLIYIIHELAHALLKHSNYVYDIDLVKMEREAWDEAIKLANIYGVKISNDEIQQTLDTYRDWLHERSKCPKCSANGIQTDKKTYQCPVCNQKWRVNEARICSLRRYQIK